MSRKSKRDYSTRIKLDTERGSFEKFRHELKNAIFNFVFILLKDNKSSMYSVFVLSFIQCLQLLIIPFHQTIKVLWKGQEIVDVVDDILNYFNLLSYLDSSNWSLYITIFYVAFALVVLILLGFLYVNFIVMQKKIAFSSPVIVLRYLCLLFTTILFLPIFYYFISVTACTSNSRGTTVHHIFTEVQCWSGAHIIHSIFSIFGSVLFVLVTGVLSLLYFDCRPNFHNPDARSSSRGHFLILAYKVVLLICLMYLTDEKYQILILALIMLGSGAIFASFFFNSVYHNEIISKLWSIIVGINLWTAVMLVFSKIMSSTVFEGSIIIWLIGIPLVTLLVIYIRDYRNDLLLININNFQSGKEVYNQVVYILKLLEWKSRSRDASILLDGFTEIHNQACNNPECPLKQKTIKAQRYTKAVLDKDGNFDEATIRMTQLLYTMYSDYGIKKFPDDISLRISYAFFLREKIQSKQQALQELSQAEQRNPAFDEQFIIFRYKRIIEVEISDVRIEGQGGLDVVDETSFQNSFRQLQANIEKCSLLYMEFWSQLNEDTPNLVKLNDIGHKLNISVQHSHENVQLLLKMNSQSTKVMTLYGKFLSEVVNDKQGGERWLERTQAITNLQATKKIVERIGATGTDYSNVSTPMIWVSGEEANFGLITEINLAVSKLFGFTKSELVNRKVNILMSKVYGKYHDSFLDNYVKNGTGQLINKNKERMVFGRNKSQYIFPIYLSLKAIHSFMQGVQFVAILRTEKSFKNTAYVLVEPDGTIDSLSASCINILKVDLRMVKRTNIEDLIPGVIQDRETMFNLNKTTGKYHTTLVYNYPENPEYMNQNDGPSVILSCQLEEVRFHGIDHIAGFFLKFERVVDKAHSSVVQTEKKAQISNFQWRFDIEKRAMMGEYVETSSTELQAFNADEYNDNSMQHSDNNSDGETPKNTLTNSAFAHLNNLQTSQNSNMTRKTSHQEEDEASIREKKPSVNFGTGIKTLQLCKGRLQEIEDESQEDESEGHQVESSNKENNEDPEADGDGYASLDFIGTFKSKEALAQMLNEKTIPSVVHVLKWVVNILGLIMIGLALGEYMYGIAKFDRINDKISKMDQSNTRLGYLMTFLNKVQDLALVNIALLDDFYNPQDLLTEATAALQQASNITHNLLEAGSLSGDHLALLNQPQVTLLSADQTTTTKDLIQSLDQVVSVAYRYLSLDIADITPDNADYFFLNYNLMNGFYQALEKDASLYHEELESEFNNKFTSGFIFLIASALTMIIGLILIFPFLVRLDSIKREIMALFLDIPDKVVNALYNKCEVFLSNLQIGEDVDMVFEADSEEMLKTQGENEANDFIPKKKKKKFRVKGKNQFTAFGKFLFVALVLEVYFIYTSSTITVLLQNVSTLLPELHSISIAERTFSVSNNAGRMFFNNSIMPIQNQDIKTVVNNNIQTLYDLHEKILAGHSMHVDLMSDEYAALFSSIMMADACQTLTNVASLSTCENFADGALSDGMTVGLLRTVEKAKALLNCYLEIQAGGNCALEVSPLRNIITTNPIQNKLLNLLRTNEAIEINEMQNTYISSVFKMLFASFQKTIDDKLDNTATVRIAACVIYISFIVAVYLILWQTFLRKALTNIWRTKSMLNMIPLSVTIKIKSIRVYLRKLWNETHLSEFN